MNLPVKKIIIADTQYLVVMTLKSLLDEMDWLSAEVVNNFSELYKVLEKDPVSLLITDPFLFDFGHLGGIQELRRIYPKLPVLILVNSLTKNELSTFTKIGIKNIIYKTAGRDDLLTAVDAIIKGKKYLDQEILDLFMELGENKQLSEEPNSLTGSEIEIVRLIASGMTTKEIAHHKHISFHTVNTHRKNIFRKIGVSNASELIMYAIKAGWIDNIEYYI